MKLTSVKFVYFSPTGTTKTVAERIARGINPTTLEQVDITLPEARTRPLQASEDDLLVVAVPVYMGRVPALVTDWLNDAQAQGTPAVCVVVYGNREYDNALLELKDSVMNCGGIPIACGAFIGEHSFSTPEIPTAQGRPDEKDRHHAETFGLKIREKFHSLTSPSQISEIEVPGTYPYGGATKIWDVDFIAVDEKCAQCGVCAAVCPTAAIDPDESADIDQGQCITCCACLKSCPQNARSIKPGPVKDAQKRLNEMCKEPRQPEYFF